MSRHVLVVDDAEPVRMAVRNALIQEGVSEGRITECEDGQRALELFARIQPDIVFMDINMPRMDGREATELILAKRPETHVVVITGRRPDDELVQNMLSMGAFDVLHKPVRHQDVKHVLRAMEEERRGAGRIH